MTVTRSDLASGSLAAPTKEEVEDFLYHEAELLDNWRLDEWLELWEPGGTYWVPATDKPEGSPKTSLFLVADDWVRLQARVSRLKSKHAHVENPRSRTQRMVSNVRLTEGEGEGTIGVRAYFVVFRIRRELNDIYPGRYEHVLSYANGGLRFRTRKAILTLEALRPAGKVSVIL